MTRPIADPSWICRSMNRQVRWGDTSLDDFDAGAARSRLVETETMSTDNSKPHWTAQVLALSVIVVALVGGADTSKQPKLDIEPVTAATTSCGRFETDARNLFENGDTATLRGTFAAGDHVHLVIDLNGVGYAWEVSGALAGQKADVTGTGWFTTITRSRVSNPASDSSASNAVVKMTSRFAASKSALSASATTASDASTTTSSVTTDGKISGRARLEVEVDVTKAGEGTITIDNAGGLQLLATPRAASASCTAATTPSARPTT